MDYLQDPEKIYQQSFEIVRKEANLEGIPKDVAEIVVRMVHSCGIPEIAQSVRWSNGAIKSAHVALKNGAPIICDTQMMLQGIMSDQRTSQNQILCMIGLPNVKKIAHDRRTTRSAAQVELWRPFLPGSIVAIGNAPTALFRLLEVISEDPTRKPAVILGLPVGFVGAAESKEALSKFSEDIEFITILGRRGGSALASAAVNAITRGSTE